MEDDSYIKNRTPKREGKYNHFQEESFPYLILDLDVGEVSANATPMSSIGCV